MRKSRDTGIPTLLSTLQTRKPRKRPPIKLFMQLGVTAHYTPLEGTVTDGVPNAKSTQPRAVILQETGESCPLPSARKHT